MLSIGFLYSWRGLCCISWGFPCGSAGRESACNAGDPSSIPGSGRSPVEGIGYPLQYSWASLVAQIVKNPPAMWETCIWPLDWEDPLEEGMATHSSILAWRIPMDRGTWQATVHGVAESDSTDGLSIQPKRTYCIAQRTLLNVMCQPGWEGSLGENGYMYM